MVAVENLKGKNHGYGELSDTLEFRRAEGANNFFEL
jgi:hypothetical protein